MQNHVLISGVSSFFWNLEIQKFAKLFSCESQNNLSYVFILSIVTLRIFLDSRKIMKDHFKEYRQNLIISKESYWLPWSWLFYPMTPSLVSHTWGEKNTTNQPTKQKPQLIITFGWMEQSGFLCCAEWALLLSHHLHRVSN